MLFVALFRPRAGTPKERLARRLQWQHPQGARPVAEYWLETTDPTVIAVFEADSIGPILAFTMEWGDVYDINVVPAITAEEGLAVAQQMRGQAGTAAGQVEIPAG